MFQWKPGNGPAQEFLINCQCLASTVREQHRVVLGVWRCSDPVAAAPDGVVPLKALTQAPWLKRSAREDAAVSENGAWAKMPKWGWRICLSIPTAKGKSKEHKGDLRKSKNISWNLRNPMKSRGITWNHKNRISRGDSLEIIRNQRRCKAMINKGKLSNLAWKLSGSFEEIAEYWIADKPASQQASQPRRQLN